MSTGIFCRRCGAELVVVYRQNAAYNESTGQRDVTQYKECPRYLPGAPWHVHDSWATMWGQGGKAP